MLSSSPSSDEEADDHEDDVDFAPAKTANAPGGARPRLIKKAKVSPESSNEDQRDEPVTPATTTTTTSKKATPKSKVKSPVSKKSPKSKASISSSDDDEQPLVKRKQPPPTPSFPSDEMITTVIQNFLKEANLETTTKKQVKRYLAEEADWGITDSQVGERVVKEKKEMISEVIDTFIEQAQE